MMLAYLGFGALFFGASTCFPYESLPKEHASAGLLFSQHMERIRKKRETTDLNHVSELLQQGADLADKIRDIFDDVSDLKLTDINHVIEVGKEVYEVGQEAVALGQDAVNTGKELYGQGEDALDAVKKAYGSAKEAYQLGKDAYLTGRQAYRNGDGGYLAAKEAYDKGLQAYDAAREAYDTGAEAFEKASALAGSASTLAGSNKNFMERHEKLINVGKTMARTAAIMSLSMGPGLAGVGIAYAVIIMTSKKDSEEAEMEELADRLQEVHGRFDQLSNQISQLSSKVDFYHAIKPYQHVRNSLENVYRDYVNVGEMPSSKGYRRTFRDACTSQEVEPLQALEMLHRVIVTPGPEDQPYMLEAIINHYGMDYQMVIGWFERITLNAYTLASLCSACTGAMLGKDDQALANTLNQTETWVMEIVNELDRYEKKFTSIDPDFVQLLKDELTDVVKGASEVEPNAEKALNDVCNTQEADLVGSGDMCVGDADVNPIRVAVNDFVLTKYDWLDWLVVVYQGNAGKEDFPCSLGEETKHFVHIVNDDQRVFVTWSRKDVDEAFSLRLSAEQTLGKLMLGFNMADAGTWGTFDGESGKYMDVYHHKVEREMHNWLESLAYPNKLFCTFDGPMNEFRRSLKTSGVGSLGIQLSTYHEINYIAAFY